MDSFLDNAIYYYAHNSNRRKPAKAMPEIDKIVLYYPHCPCPAKHAAHHRCRPRVKKLHKQ